MKYHELSLAPNQMKLLKDPDRLYFPSEITEDIGISKNEINALKKIGCPFFGMKTTIRWVRKFIREQAGAAAPRGPAQNGDRRRRAESKSREPACSND